MSFRFDSYVTEILFDGQRAAFALGDGRVCWQDGQSVAAHDGAILVAAAHPSGDGVLTGGDDGRLVWSRGGGGETIAELAGGWIDALAASPASGRESTDPEYSAAADGSGAPRGDSKSGISEELLSRRAAIDPSR